MITIVDYGMGNLRSVLKKLEMLNITAKVTNDPKTISTSDKIILPGVGHFVTGVNNLKKNNLWNVLNELVLVKKIPILGICLGMQLMSDFSEEGSGLGFSWIKSQVVKFKITDTLRYKVPHIGWNHITPVNNNILLKGITKNDLFYFIHSYHINCFNKSNILSTTDYEYTFTSSIISDNIFGVQFHPEKSQQAGEIILNNYKLL